MPRPARSPNSIVDPDLARPPTHVGGSPRTLVATSSRAEDVRPQVSSSVPCILNNSFSASARIGIRLEQIARMQPR